MSYEIVRGKSSVSEAPYVFENSVKERMKEGWIPLGGVSTCREGHFIVYSQAMTKKDFIFLGQSN